MTLPGSRGKARSPLRIGPIFSFGLVGTAAALIHLAVVGLLAGRGIHPLAANVVAFFTAFGVSYLGHRQWTFPSSGHPRPMALPRFLAVALSAFALNESLYALLLSTTPLGYEVALVIVLAIVASMTFLAGKFWAFADACS